jgi:nucleotide-binding universal stress UspA family protein
MLRLKSILCPIDFSEFSTRAYDYAQSLAAHYKSELLLLHVLYAISPFYSDPAYQETCRLLRANALRKLKLFVKRRTRTRVQPRCIIAEGNATDEILSLAKTQRVRLIVMGTHGLRGLDRMMVGSVTGRVLRKAKCPVLAVRKPVHDFVSPATKGDPMSLKKIIVCMDFSQHAHRALNLALSISKEYGAELTVLHVLERFLGSADLGSLTAKITRRLEKTMPAGSRKAVVPGFLVRIGNPYQQIVELASEAQTDLVVLGVRGHGSLDSALFGSTAYRVIQLGLCPVLAVHI